jgi:hypothetical protein
MEKVDLQAGISDIWGVLSMSVVVENCVLSVMGVTGFVIHLQIPQKH